MKGTDMYKINRLGVLLFVDATKEAGRVLLVMA